MSCKVGFADEPEFKIAMYVFERMDVEAVRREGFLDLTNAITYRMGNKRSRVRLAGLGLCSLTKVPNCTPCVSVKPKTRPQVSDK